MTKTWFITGASKGFGREWAEAALERGDDVAATARELEALDPLVDTYGDAVLPIRLDVTDRGADFAALNRAAERFGQLDVVINNAGNGHFGMVEELTEDEVRAQLETNFFGALWVTQAALPIMRAQGSGHIIQVSSVGGITAFPAIGPITHDSPGDPTATRGAILKVVDAEEPPLRIFSAGPRSRSRPRSTSHAWLYGTSGSPSRSRPTGRRRRLRRPRPRTA